MPPDPILTADTVRRALSTVLSSEEFATREPSPLGTLLARVGTWMWEMLSRVVAWLFRDVDLQAPGWDLLGRLLVLATASIGVWLVVRQVRIAVGAARRRAHKAGARSGPPSVEERTAVEWEALARAARLDQRWREASLALYHAVILRLAEGGRVRPSASKTPGDYRREVGRGVEDDDPFDLVGKVGEFSRLFERVAFARSNPGADDYDRLRQMADPLGARG